MFSIGTFNEPNPPGPGATQPDTPGDYSVSINWGDGTAADAVTGAVGIVQGTVADTIFKVSGTTRFAAAGMRHDRRHDHRRRRPDHDHDGSRRHRQAHSRAATANLPESVTLNQMIATFSRHRSHGARPATSR